MFNNQKSHIRLINFDDLELVLQWRNSDRIRASMYSDQIISWEQHTMWFEHMQKNGSSIFLVYEYEGVPAGAVNFGQIDRKNSKCLWGFYLGRDDLPKGTGTIMGRLGLTYAFEKLNMRKICGEAFAYNIASIKLHEKLGFQNEGLFNQHILKNGKYEDIALFGLLKDHFKSRSWLDE